METTIGKKIMELYFTHQRQNLYNQLFCYQAVGSLVTSLKNLMHFFLTTDTKVTLINTQALDLCPKYNSKLLCQHIIASIDLNQVFLRSFVHNAPHIHQKWAYLKREFSALNTETDTTKIVTYETANVRQAISFKLNQLYLNEEPCHNSDNGVSRLM